MNCKRLRDTGAPRYEILIPMSIPFTLGGCRELGVGSFIRLDNHNTFEMVGAYARGYQACHTSIKSSFQYSKCINQMEKQAFLTFHRQQLPFQRVYLAKNVSEVRLNRP
jgi:hypothetical protein